MDASGMPCISVTENENVQLFDDAHVEILIYCFVIPLTKATFWRFRASNKKCFIMMRSFVYLIKKESKLPL